MRVLYVTTEFPWPPSAGGRVRSLAELRLLHSLPEVTRLLVLTLAEDPVNRDDVSALSKELPRAELLAPIFHPIHLKRFPRHVPRVALVRALARVPYLAAKWDGRAIRRSLVHHLSKETFDVVYIDHLGMARYLPEIRKCQPRARVVLEQHNVESDFFGQFAAKKHGAVGIVARDEHRLAVRFERDTMRAVDAVVAISTDDARTFKTLAGIDAVVVPQIVPFVRRDYAPSAPPELLYVGSLAWHPNVAGLDWFCRDVWPLLHARAPEITLSIVGSGLQKNASGKPIVPVAWQLPGITTHGFVQELAPYEARATAMIAPISGGSGVRIKLLEGFRAGLPIVTTKAGAAGLPLEDGRELFIADDPKIFADRVIELARPGEGTAAAHALAERLRVSAYTYLETHHGLEVAQNAIRRAISSSLSAAQLA
jgi:glycosyltransferase involved in cell wall biosynthesis